MRYSVMTEKDGDKPMTFDTKTKDGVDAAMKMFDELTKKGYRAAEVGAVGEPGRILKGFDETAENVIFFPQLAGG
jgi:hypothetical protein